MSAAAPRGGGDAIRRTVVLIAALGLMVGLHILRAEQGGGAADPLTLAGIGFVVLAAFTIGEIASSLGLPKVTGYILTGMALGPSISGLLSDRVVQEMGTFNTLALGFIALSAGLELHVPAIRRVGRTLAAIVLAKLPLLLLLVGGGVVALQHIWPVVAVDSGAPLYVLAAVLAVLGVGTSPAIALAVVNDSGAKGRLTDLVLGIAVVKDLVVVVCLAVTLAVARPLLEGGGGGDGVILHLAIELFGSVALGAAIGGLLILYLRTLGAEMLAFAVGVVLVTAEISGALHLELLLVLIAAGFVVRNFSDYEHALLDPIQRVSLPVFVVFFTTAGAALDLHGALGILPLAILVAVTRAGAYYIASRAGTRLTREPAPIAQNAWMAFIPQAGVTLGLVLISAAALPSLGEHLRSVGMAVVAINLLVGPVTLGMALRRAGEVGAARGPVVERFAPGAAQRAPVVREPSIALDLPPIPLPDELGEPLRELEVRLTSAIEALRRDHLDSIAAAARLTMESAAREATLRHPIEAVRRAVPALEVLAQEPVDEALLALLGHVGSAISDLPGHVAVPVEPSLLRRRPGDSPRLRARRLAARLRVRVSARARVRTVPLRVVAHIELDRRIAEAVRAAIGSRFRLDAQLTDVLRTLAEGGRTPAGTIGHAEDLVDAWCDSVEDDLRLAVRRGMVATVRAAAIAGGPERPVRGIRYSSVEQDVQAAVMGARADVAAWTLHREGLRGALLANLHVRSASAQLTALAQTRGAEPLRESAEAFGVMVSEVAARLRALRDELGGTPPEGWPPARETTARIEDAWPRAARRDVRRLRSGVRAGTRPDELTAALLDGLVLHPEPLRVLHGVHPTAAREPSELHARTVDLTTRLEADVVDRVVPAMTRVLTPPSELMAALPGRIGRAIDVARYGIELASTAEMDAPGARSQAVTGSLDRASVALDELAVELSTLCERATEHLQAVHDSALERWSGMLTEDAEATGRRVRGAYDRVMRRARAARDRGVARLRAARERAVAMLTELGTRRGVHDRRLRSGYERLDPQGMAAYLAEYVPAPTALHLPPVYTRLFTPEPVTDRRLFVARRDLLRSLTGELTDADWSTPRSVLVVGEEGSGRTSLINMIHPQLREQRVVRLDVALSSSRRLLQGLATELGAPPTVDALAAALELRRTVVLIDDLHCWFRPDEQGLDDLDQLTSIVLRTGANVRWLVTLDGRVEGQLQPLVSLNAVFGRRVVLRPLGWEDLRAVVDRRLELGGFSPRFSMRSRLGARMPFLRRRETDSWFKALHRASGGNLRTALLAHLRSVRDEGEGRLVAGEPPDPGLPFFGQLPDTALAVLSLVARHGAADVQQLEGLLRGGREEIAAQVRRLTIAGLLAPERRGSHLLQIPAHVGPSVDHGLREVGVLGEVTR